MSSTFIGYILAIVHLKTNISALVSEFGLVPGSGIFLYIFFMIQSILQYFLVS